MSRGFFSTRESCRAAHCPCDPKCRLVVIIIIGAKKNEIRQDHVLHRIGPFFIVTTAAAQRFFLSCRPSLSKDAFFSLRDDEARGDSLLKDRTRDACSTAQCSSDLEPIQLLHCTAPRNKLIDWKRRERCKSLFRLLYLSTLTLRLYGWVA